MTTSTRSREWMFGYQELLGTLDDWSHMSMADEVYEHPDYLKGRRAGIDQLKKNQLKQLILEDPK